MSKPTIEQVIDYCRKRASEIDTGKAKSMSNALFECGKLKAYQEVIDFIEDSFMLEICKRAYRDVDHDMGGSCKSTSRTYHLEDRDPL